MALAGLDIYPTRQVVTSLTPTVSQNLRRSGSKISDFIIPVAGNRLHRIPHNMIPARYISAPG